MRAPAPAPDLARIARQIELSYGMSSIRSAPGPWSQATSETCLSVLDAADRFARGTLEPLDLAMDETGCRLVDGRVRTAPGHIEAWRSYREAGWPTLEAPEACGGQGLPAVLAFAAQEVFDRACPAFGMLPVPQRSAFRLIAAYGGEAMRSEWLPRLASGEWGATICVSEPGAGSDLPRITSRAEPDEEGGWRISGEKCWISFGDQDLTEQIGHIVLAQTATSEGKRRPSLILVPAVLPDGQRNAIAVRRIEHKLGLHGSPTCALGFEAARGWLLGEPGRGLPQMFVMIANMRLAVGAMGLGIASRSADVALSYAEARKQGGRPDPVVIAEHPDVQLQLLDMAAPVHLLRGLLYAVANCTDLAAAGDGEAGALAAWLLPVIKTIGGETGFAVASAAIQVLGGAGYTREWPVEQALRDARVLTVFEGTTGIQAQDLVHRRLIDQDASYEAFLATAATDADPRLEACLTTLRTAADKLRGAPATADAAATAFLQLASVTAFAWIASRYCRPDNDDPVLRALADHWLDLAPAKARLRLAKLELNPLRVDRFGVLRAQG